MVGDKNRMLVDADSLIYIISIIIIIKLNKQGRHATKMQLAYVLIEHMSNTQFSRQFSKRNNVLLCTVTKKLLKNNKTRPRDRLRSFNWSMEWQSSVCIFTISSLNQYTTYKTHLTNCTWNCIWNTKKPLVDKSLLPEPQKLGSWKLTRNNTFIRLLCTNQIMD